MSLSLGQIEATARKAVRGAGICWGLADDAGRAVRRLEMAGLPATRWLVALLDRLDHRDVETSGLRIGKGGWHHPSGKLSPLVAGPNLGDWILAPREERQQARLHLEGVVCPALLAGYASIAVLLCRQPVLLGWDDADIGIFPDHLRIHGEPDSIGPTRVVVQTGRETSGMEKDYHRTVFRTAAREVDPCTLDVLESLAYHTYVEASESSRLSGAGAGLSDND